MKPAWKTVHFAITLLTVVFGGHAENWPAWRGPRGDGSSLEKNVPVHWSATSNVVWKTALPGGGHASPVVWGDRVFTVSAVAPTQERLLLCLDRDSGRLVWQKNVLTSPMERKHAQNSHASSTPATDGQRVYVAFLDNKEMVVAAYDFEGNELWKVRPGTFASVHGFCSSPLLYQDKVILNGDHDGESYLVALDKKTGKTVWKTPRQNQTRSYCAPLIRDMAGRTQMVLSGDKCVASYDPATGRLLWMLDGPTDQFVASPVYSKKTGLVYITGGYPDHHILALKPDGAGKIGEEKIVWRTHRGVAYVPSPIIEGDYFLVVSDSGVAHCFDAATGEILWQERMGHHHTSLVSAEGRVYFIHRDGQEGVEQPGRKLQFVAKTELSEGCYASPAISRKHLFIRGDKHLFCIGGK